MTERPFEALGLSADADRAYPLLIATRGVTGPELARQLGVPPERAEAACGELASRDLVRLGRDGRWYPRPPQSGLLPLVSRAQEQLRYGRELLDRLGVEYQRVHEGHRAEGIVQVVEGAAAIQRRVAEAHTQARVELAILARPPGEAGEEDLLACPAGAPDAESATGSAAGAGTAFRSGPHGVISGTVTDHATGSPLADATVKAGDNSATSDATGTYRLDIPPDSYEVTASAYGYTGATTSGVVVTDGGSNFTLLKD